MINDPEEYNDIVEGKNPIAEVIKTGRHIDKLWVAVPDNGRFDPFTYKLMKDAKDNGAVIIETNRKTLDKMSVTHGHQGIIARISAHEYAEFDQVLQLAEQRGEAPFIIILDGLKDSYNLGSVLRIADAAGVHGVVIPKHRSVGLDAAVAKASAGAIEHIPVVKVTNIAAFIDDIKKKNFWVYAAHQDAEKMYYEIDYSGSSAIVIGSEGEGISSKVISRSDFVVKIPMRGEVNSLNAAVAAGIIVFEAAKSRFKKV